MIHRLSLVGFLGILLQISFAQPNSAFQTEKAISKQIVVGTNVQVSRQRADQQHYEVQIAADPENPRHLLACSMRRANHPWHSVVAYLSFDAGASWNETLHVDEGYVSDPSCTYGSGGVAYIVTLATELPAVPDRVQVFRSTDAGKTWAKPVKLPFMDREYLTVDNTSGRYRGQVYLNGSGSISSIEPKAKRIGAVNLWRSSNFGVTFSGPTQLGVTQPNHIFEGMGNGVVLSDGTFVSINGDLNETQYDQSKPYKPIGHIVAVSSNDGGQTFSPAVKISDWYPDRGHKRTCSVIPVLAVDSSSGRFKDRLYAVWADLRFGRMAVVISHSSDKGKTWSLPRRVSDDIHRDYLPNASDDFNPTVAANSQGIVGVMWYDRRESFDNLGYWPRFSASLDGGKTFLPSVKVSEAPSSFKKPNLMSLSSLGSSIGDDGKLFFWVGMDFFHATGGDTSGLAASPDGVFHPLWVDNRTGVSQVWTAAVKVAPLAAQNLPRELQSLSNVTDRVKVFLGPAVYNRAKHMVTVEASLENTSKEQLRGIVRVQLLSLSSPLGKALVVNADNNLDQAGAIWDFTQQLENGVLNAGERSRPKRLEFYLTEMPEAARAYKAWLSIIQVQAQVFASVGTQTLKQKLDAHK
jgi:hypothetical protein